MEPFEVIQKLRSDNSRLAKEAFVKEAWDVNCIDFFRGAKLCLDGLVTFGVKQIPEKPVNTGNENATYEDFITKLADPLRKRELTGHAARDAIISFVADCDKDAWNSFYRLILLKDFKSGFSESTINKVLKKIGKQTEEFIIHEMPYQRCCLPKHTKLEEFPWKSGVYSQKKSDGMFANVNVQIDGSVDILSRSGKMFPIDEFEALVKELAQHFERGTQSHGELLVFRDGKELSREIGNGILNSVSQGGKFDQGDVPVYVVWDQIDLSDAVKKGTCYTPYHERLDSVICQASMTSDTNIKVVEMRLVHDMNEAMDHYREMLEQGFEGTIIKDPRAIWKDGTSKQQVKLKLETDIDLEIVGFNAGNGKNEPTFGSINVKSSDGLLEVNISGFTDEDRVKVWAQRDELIGKIMTIRGNSIMKPTSSNQKYSIFLPRFVEFRQDKTQADTLQSVKDQFEASLKA